MTKPRRAHAWGEGLREEWVGADVLTFGAREGGGSASGEKCLYVLAFGVQPCVQ
jgi:hypothetical protein